VLTRSFPTMNLCPVNSQVDRDFIWTVVLFQPLAGWNLLQHVTARSTAGVADPPPVMEHLPRVTTVRNDLQSTAHIRRRFVQEAVQIFVLHLRIREEKR